MYLPTQVKNPKLNNISKYTLDKHALDFSTINKQILLYKHLKTI